jgi:sugar phosphate permease
MGRKLFFHFVRAVPGIITDDKHQKMIVGVLVSQICCAILGQKQSALTIGTLLKFLLNWFTIRKSSASATTLEL